MPNEKMCSEVAERENKHRLGGAEKLMGASSKLSHQT